MSNLIKMPAQLEQKKTIAMLLYGQPGMGKTTLACSAPDAVLFDFDGGVSRLRFEHQVPTVPVGSWETAMEALRELESAPGQFKTIVVDTLSKMVDCIVTSICGTQQPKIQQWGMVNAKFRTFLRGVQSLGLNVVFVAQRAVEKDGDVTRYVPDVRAGNYKDVVCDLDLIGYMEVVDVRGVNTRRVTFNPSPRSEGKNSGGFEPYYDLQELPQGIRCTWLEDRFAEYVARQTAIDEQRRQSASEGQQMLAEFGEMLKGCNDAMSVNELCAWVKDRRPVGDAKLRMSEAVKAKVAELGLKRNKETKLYE